MGIKHYKLRVFIDSDVLFAGSASPHQHSASLVILQMAEITLIEAIVSQQVIAEVERNLIAKLPAALPIFRDLVRRCLHIVPDPSHEEVQSIAGKADKKDLSILAAAVRENCKFLVTFNMRDYQPGLDDVIVMRPGDFINQVRMSLANLDNT